MPSGKVGLSWRFYIHRVSAVIQRLDSKSPSRAGEAGWDGASPMAWDYGSAGVPAAEADCRFRGQDHDQVPQEPPVGPRGRAVRRRRRCSHGNARMSIAQASRKRDTRIVSGSG